MNEDNPDNKRSRPYMPGYGVDGADTQDGMLTWAWVSEQMARSRNYWIGTTRPDGRPHIAPVWGIWQDAKLLFGVGRASRKGKNLAANPAITVNLESGDEVVILEGRVVEETDQDVLARMAQAYGQKYVSFQPEKLPENPETDAVYRVEPDTVFAWFENDFVRTATRWKLRDA